MARNFDKTAVGFKKGPDLLRIFTRSQVYLETVYNCVFGLNFVL